MVALDTYQDNLCLWRCIAVHRGARPDRSTQVARGLAKSFFKLKTMPTDCPKTSLDELDKVEIHLNKGTASSDWLGIRVYVPEQGKDAEAVWHLTRNWKNIMTIGVLGWGARVLNKRHCKVGENLCMRPLQREIYTSWQSSTSCPKVCPRENGNRLPRRKGRSAADSFRESILPKASSFQRIASVA